MTLDAIFAISLPFLLIGGITTVTWLFVRRRHQREREQGTYRPPLLLRITGVFTVFVGAIFLPIGITQIMVALSAGSPITDDFVAQAVIGVVFLLVGLFLWLKNSTRLTLGSEGLSYCKYLVVKGTMNYGDIESVVTSKLTQVTTITLRDIQGKKLDMPAGSVDWSRLIEWALTNSRSDISGIFSVSPHMEVTKSSSENSKYSPEWKQ
ncbi:hypothetical protein AAFM46_13120 [Arthrobacter sp. TMP15]|uniref:hypothetical protein n=1 Tax=Arthrobacter sp. TMP15 TaxID=3140789 RepID=UPI0031BA581D